MGNGIFTDEVTVWIADADTAGSALASSDAVTGEISNFSESGAEKELDSIPVFGGGNLEKETPRTQAEVSFDIQMQYDPDAGLVTKWDAFKYGAGLTSATEGTSKVIYVQWVSGSNYYTRAYNNARGVSFSPTAGAEDNLTGTITFKLPPTTTAAAANIKIASAAASTLTWS